MHKEYEEIGKQGSRLDWGSELARRWMEMGDGSETG